MTFRHDLAESVRGYNHRSKQLQITQKTKIRGITGFEPMASALALRRSSNRAMNLACPQTLGAAC